MSASLKILFICSRNEWRSRTAEEIFRGTPGWSVKSAGTERSARVRLTAGLIGWADVLVAMERKHVDRIRAGFADVLPGKRLICLRIPDDWEYMNPELIELLRGRMAEHFGAATEDRAS